LNSEKMRKKTVLVLGIVTFLIAFSFTLFIISNDSRAGINISSIYNSGQDQFLAPTEMKETEILMIYIGSSTCGFCKDERLPGYISDIRTELWERVRSSSPKNELSFFTMGISKDWDVEGGLNHLIEMGPFHEVMTGKSWNNTGLSRYVYENFPGEAATPQIVVTEREYYSITGSITSYRGIKNERILTRKIGLDEIKEWSNNGVKLKF